MCRLYEIEYGFGVWNSLASFERNPDPICVSRLYICSLFSHAVVGHCWPRELASEFCTKFLHAFSFHCYESVAPFWSEPKPFFKSTAKPKIAFAFGIFFCLSIVIKYIYSDWGQLLCMANNAYTHLFINREKARDDGRITTIENPFVSSVYWMEIEWNITNEWMHGDFLGFDFRSTAQSVCMFECVRRTKRKSPFLLGCTVHTDTLTHSIRMDWLPHLHSFGFYRPAMEYDQKMRMHCSSRA